MIRATAERIVQMVNGTLVQGDPFTEVYGVSTDSRADLSGRLFVPLIGERFDAHDFIPQAIEKGAAAVFLQKGKDLPEGLSSEAAVIEVEDTLKALQQLAKSYRKSLEMTVIGITGSNGKTSTKDMVTSVLSERFKVQKTQGNLNNHIGLPLMVLSLEPDTEVAVLEMGMSAAGEIALLADIAMPQIGIITNIGEAHLEYLGSREGIAQAKFELIETLPENGLALLFGDEPLLRQLEQKIPCEVQWFGFSENNSIRAVHVKQLGLAGSSFHIENHGKYEGDFAYHVKIPGLHQVGNALASIAAGLYLGLSKEQVAAGLEKTTLSAMRMEVVKRPAGGFIINDAYNASPTSMKAAIRMLAETPDTDYRVAVVGDMLELGEYAEQMHFEIGQLAGQLGIDLLVAVGGYAESVGKGAIASGMETDKVYIADSKPLAVEAVVQHTAGKQSPVILVKASRGMKMEQVVTGLLA
jgi:UDP-N-acetylmuramoyl-tripeptide--D-alanyl-D-alanine ligase